MVKIDEFELKEDLYYWRAFYSSWVKVEPDGNVRVGITDIAAYSFVRAVTSVKPESEGIEVERGGTLVKIRIPKGTVSIEAPISGKIVKVNEELVKTPKLVRDDPYGRGWIALIKPTNLENELKDLFKGSDSNTLSWYKKEVERRIRR